MKVLMKKNAPGSTDGINVLHYKNGRKYDIPEKLAKTFIENGFAEIEGKTVEPEKPETKPLKPDNKMADHDSVEKKSEEADKSGKSNKKDDHKSRK